MTQGVAGLMFRATGVDEPPDADGEIEDEDRAERSETIARDRLFQEAMRRATR